MSKVDVTSSSSDSSGGSADSVSISQYVEAVKVLETLQNACTSCEEAHFRVSDAQFTELSRRLRAILKYGMPSWCRQFSRYLFGESLQGSTDSPGHLAKERFWTATPVPLPLRTTRGSLRKPGCAAEGDKRNARRERNSVSIDRSIYPAHLAPKKTVKKKVRNICDQGPAPKQRKRNVELVDPELCSAVDDDDTWVDFHCVSRGGAWEELQKRLDSEQTDIATGPVCDSEAFYSLRAQVMFGTRSMEF
ncbi:hypothetical protein V5799_005570 [Amblyomma americanum]|uniref:Uncharacterized protein n=1 Tax=Amblyomma americanum TaxID=6943 RepID=A0AAQ4DYW0_AMBAM